jgi:hypothetical protein
MFSCMPGLLISSAHVQLGDGLPNIGLCVLGIPTYSSQALFLIAWSILTEDELLKD